MNIRGQKVSWVVAGAWCIEAIALGLSAGHQAKPAIRGDLPHPEKVKKDREMHVFAKKKKTDKCEEDLKAGRLSELSNHY